MPVPGGLSTVQPHRITIRDAHTEHIRPLAGPFNGHEPRENRRVAHAAGERGAGRRVRRLGHAVVARPEVEVDDVLWVRGDGVGCEEEPVKADVDVLVASDSVRTGWEVKGEGGLDSRQRA